jgi:hypothetical protein
MTDEELRAWQTAGFDDPDEIADWLAARCPTPAVAQRLEQLGFTPAQAALRTRAGAGDYEDTIAGKLARFGMIDAAVRSTALGRKPCA